MCTHRLGYKAGASTTDHVTRLDFLLEGLGLVQSPWETVNQETAAATLQHGLLQQADCHL